MLGDPEVTHMSEKLAPPSEVGSLVGSATWDVVRGTTSCPVTRSGNQKGVLLYPTLFGFSP